MIPYGIEHCQAELACYFVYGLGETLHFLRTFGRGLTIHITTSRFTPSYPPAPTNRNRFQRSDFDGLLREEPTRRHQSAQSFRRRSRSAPFFQ